MSPEQARGKTVDKRTDIWAFGCVLYEMLTGTRVFAADDASGILARVLMTEPDWDLLPARTPASIRRLLQRCLEKDPKRRLRDIADVGFQVDDALNAAPPGATTAHIRKRHERVWWMAALLVVVVGMMTLYFRRAPTPQGSPAITRLTVALPAGDRLGNLATRAIALSPGVCRGTFVDTSASWFGWTAKVALRRSPFPRVTIRLSLFRRMVVRRRSRLKTAGPAFGFTTSTARR
jgi:hypothetical protein